MASFAGITYVERAVQTEPPCLLSRLDDDLNTHEPLPHTNVDAAYSQTSSLAISKRDYKLSQLAYKKPSGLNVPIKRIVSLPETSPPSRIKSDTIRDRVVSMTEQVKASLVSSADNSISSDCFESSVDTSQSQLSSDLGNVSARRTRPRHSLAYPQTPSPPSSPESIMIIGNNMQVPSTFLRQNANNLPKTLDDDVNSWNTWASSPPRPIPALHGPLSLPYARCPSGAEGTIIEGEDMTRAIWGLGNDACAREHDVDSKLNQPPDQCFPVQKSETFALTELPTRFRILSNTPLKPAEQRNTFGKPFSDDDLHVSPNIPGIDDLHRLQLSDNLKRSEKGRNPVQGLGLAWGDTQSPIPNLQGVNDQPHLKASAPVFIPRGRLSEHSQPRISVEPAVRSHYIVPKPQIPAIDLALEYRHRVQQEGKTPLLASPSSTSSTWSPYLPTPLPLHSERLADVWHSEDAADELRRFIFERIGQQNLSPADLKQISELARSMNLDRIAAYPSSSHDKPFSTSKISLGYPSSNLDVDLHLPGHPPNTPLPPIPSQRPGAIRLALPSSSSSVLRMGPSNVPPRSVPFARLLQRRLSIVPEESANTEHPPTSPRIERSAFGGGAEPQQYKPYFAHTGGQKVSRLPDISNNVSDRRCSHSHSSNSGGEAFTAGNLEVGEYIQLGSRISSTNAGTHTRVAKPFFQGGKVSDERLRKSRSSIVDTPGVVANKENGVAIGRSGSADSNKSLKTFSSTAGKETGRKKPKSKFRKQEHDSNNAGTSTPSAWLSGSELDAWLV